MADSVGYPPDPHLLRDLEFTSTRGPHHNRLSTSVDELRCDPDGRVPAGVIATLIDVGGAGLALTEVAPDWIATADLSYHGRPVGPGRLTVDVVPLRAGSKLVVLEAQVGRDDEPIGRGLLTFARIPGSASRVDFDPDDDSDHTVDLSPSVPLAVPLIERCAIGVTDPAGGGVEMPVTDYVRNSFGAINGGVLALIADESARAVGRDHLGRPVVTTDLELHYLDQVRSGPARATAAVLHRTTDTCTVRVLVVDAGHDDRPLTVAIATVAAPD